MFILMFFSDLSFKRGDIIILRKRIDNNWYKGECGGVQGVFPLSYVQVSDIFHPYISHFNVSFRNVHSANYLTPLLHLLVELYRFVMTFVHE